MTCKHTLSLGAYLLGALDPAERSAFEAHLTGCAACRGELVQLAPLPGLLHRISPEDFEDGVEDIPFEVTAADLAAAEGSAFTDSAFTDSAFTDPVFSDSAYSDPAREADAEQRLAAPAGQAKVVPIADRRKKPRRLGLMAAAAAAVVALCVGGVLGYQALRVPTAPQPVAVSWSATDAASGVRADVDLTDRAWGTEVAIRLHDVPPGKPCKLVVRDRHGNREIAGWWDTGYAQGERIPGSTSIDLAKIARLEVITDDDIVLVDVPAPS
ncbi:anti-sigma factor family protein [Actinokineospora iranica]|uniref:Putative zinc-finger n=1 Tax=Actinokineospora iranica TaxID=1271860 RepID=A0A1G6NC06_9PSEU|nr:zf-HC2 domain-containing protein [Actinokineospora iranica]SDC64715.1 Putative zinc-finger [Actinokineospora iranica]